MQVPIRVVTLAHKEALVAFSHLIDAMIDTADSVLGHTIRTVSGHDQHRLEVARLDLLKLGGHLRVSLNDTYQRLLERAMRTMHKDLRSTLGDIRADALSLVEDDVMTRDIEVDRLVKRLRDADDISLGHLNMIIAQLHGVSEVNERENPFRPYLLARALHDCVRDTFDKTSAEILFQQLASTMAMQLGKFYSRIRDVFESQGVRSRLLARPSALSRYERDRLALKRAADLILGKVDTGLDDPSSEMRARMVPRMERMLEISKYEAAAGEIKPGSGGKAKPANLQELVWDVFHQSRASRPARKVAEEDDKSRLEAALVDLQAKAVAAAQGEPPLTVRDRIAGLATQDERLSVDLMALLFDFIQHDEQLQAPVRQQLIRLHVPFMRAALLQPSLLHDASHPARGLLNRAGSLGVASAEAPATDAVLRELQRIITDVLRRFDGDPVVFVEADAALAAFVDRQLTQSDPIVARASAALERAELAGPVLESMRDTLRDLLEGITVDRRVSTFIVDTWAQVIVHCHEVRPAYSAMLPELLWSAQERPGPEDRAILMRLLPDLGKRLRAGLALIGKPEARAKEALDLLVGLHMDVLANKRLRSNAVRLSQEELKEELAAFRPEMLFALARSEGKTGTATADIVAALAVEGLDITLVQDPARFMEQTEDADCLQWMRPGTSFELMVDNEYRPLLLEVASAGGQAFMFRDHRKVRTVYPRRALLAAMRSSTLRTLEHTSLFERAVESLMTGAETLAA